MLSGIKRIEPSLKKQSYFFFSGKLIAFAIQFVTPVILVRLLTKEDYGFYQLAILIALTFQPILGLGLNSSLYYFFRIYSKKRAQLLTQTFLMTHAIGIVALIIYFVITEHVTSVFGIKFETTSALPIVLLIFFMLLSSILDHIFVVERKALLNAIYLILEQLFRTLFLIIVIYYYRDIYFAIWGLVAFYLLKYFVVFGYLFLNYGKFLKITDANLIREQLKYSLPFGAGVIVGEIGNKMDKFIVSSVVGISKFASYSVASFRIPLLEMFYASIYNVAIPELSEYSSKGDKESAKLLLNKIILKTSMITIPVVVFFEINADMIIAVLFTDKYLDSIWPFRIILLTMMFQMTGRGLILRSFKKTTVQFRIALIMLCISVVFGIILTYAFGIIGAAITFVIAIGTAHILTFFEEIKILGIKFWERFPLHDLGYLLGISFLSILLTIPVYIFKEENGYINTIILSAIIYFPLIAYFLQKKSYINISLNVLKLRKILNLVK